MSEGTRYYYNMASGYRRAEQPQKALDMLHHALKREPKNRIFLSEELATLKGMGRDEEARSIFEKAKTGGLWQNDYQYPGEYNPSLTASPWHDIDDYRRGGHPLSKLIDVLESRWGAIYEEYKKHKDQIPLHYQADLAHKLSRKKWKGCKVAPAHVKETDGEAFDRFCVFPVTRLALDDAMAASGITIANGKFSVLSPMSMINIHVGPSNNRLKLHLGLSVPSEEEAAMTIGGVRRGWRQGKVNILDDSFEHSVYHNGTQDRVILDIVIEHPDHKGKLSTRSSHPDHKADTTRKSSVTHGQGEEDL